MGSKENKNKVEHKNKKMKIILLSLFSLFILIVSGYYIYREYYLPSKTDYTVEVYGANDIVYDTLTFKEDSYIQVLNETDEVVKKIQLKEDMKNIILEGKDTDNLIFKKWEFEEKKEEKEEFYKRDISYFNAKPVYIDKEDFILTFETDEKATLISDKQKVSFLNSPYKKDTDITTYFPEVLVDEDYKGKWFIAENEVDKDTEIKENSKLEFKTYQDNNDNSIDDFTEEFKVDFVTSTDEEVESKVVNWEETIDLPILEEENKVFYEWYSDKDFKNEFTEETKITNDLMLYAKFKNFEEVIKESVNDPIDRKDIALQISKMLKVNNQLVDESYKKEIEKKEQEVEETRKYNEENNIVSQNIEVEINLHNMAQEKLYLINFVDPSNQFIYSIVAPYGQTIKVLNENGNLYKEYGVRQNTTIILDNDTLLSNSSDLDEYYSEYREINDTVFVIVQPVVK